MMKNVYSNILFLMIVSHLTGTSEAKIFSSDFQKAQDLDLKSLKKSYVDSTGYHGKYTFSFEFFKQLQKEVLGTVAPAVPGKGKDVTAMLNKVHQKIYDAYPEIVIPPGQNQWSFNSVGGEFTVLSILYCSPTEVLGFWGAPGRVVGASGRYSSMEHVDILLDGKMTVWTATPLPGGEQKITYENGTEYNMNHTKPNHNYGISIDDDGMYEITYSRGVLLPSIRVGGIIGPKYVSGDKKSGRELLFACAKEAIKNMFDKKRKKAIEHYRNTNPDYVNVTQ
jgi:hypothetical protein